MNRFTSVMVFVLCVIPLAGRAEEVIRRGELLTLGRCLEISLVKNPAIVAARNTVNVNESRVGQARSNYYPQVNWTSGYSRISANAGSTRSTAAEGQILTSSGGSFNQYSSSASLNQNIFDFGRTSTQVQISRLNFDSSRSDLENVTEQVIFTVKQAYFSVLQARRNREVAADTVRQFEQHLAQAKGFFEVGTKPKFDVTKAEADLSNARLNLIKAENAVRLAMVSLNNAMGVTDAPEFAIEDNLSYAQYGITLDEALAKANENRPDLFSLVAKRQAGESSVDLAKKNYYPVITGTAAYSWSGASFPLDHGWNVGATLTFPLFSGFLTKYQVEEARANLSVLRANEESLRQAVFLDVQQAYLTLREAEERVPTAELGVRQAQENFDIADGRYAAGVGSPIEVTDAEVLLVNAKTAYIQALYDHKVARARLEKAMGTR